MLITFSPAKLIDFETSIKFQETSIPFFEKETQEIISILKNQSIEQLASLMHINPKQAHEVYQQIQTFDLNESKHQQALFTYSGIAFQGLDAKSLLDEDILFAQKHLLIFSGLYGILKPLDMIQAYRLEMQARLSTYRGNNLYDFWRDTLTQFFVDQLNNTGKVWVDLMSTEYSKVINRKLLPKNTEIITPIFKEQSDKGYRQVVVYTKKARGLMTRFILQNRIENPEYIKAFDLEGYSYSYQLSNSKEWVFIR